MKKGRERVRERERVRAVSYTHLDVYKRQQLLFTINEFVNTD